jgi:hypothetical protein
LLLYYNPYMTRGEFEDTGDILIGNGVDIFQDGKRNGYWMRETNKRAAILVRHALVAKYAQVFTNNYGLGSDRFVTLGSSFLLQKHESNLAMPVPGSATFYDLTTIPPLIREKIDHNTRLTSGDIGFMIIGSSAYTHFDFNPVKPCITQNVAKADAKDLGIPCGASLSVDQTSYLSLDLKTENSLWARVETWYGHNKKSRYHLPGDVLLSANVIFHDKSDPAAIVYCPISSHNINCVVAGRSVVISTYLSKGTMFKVRLSMQKGLLAIEIFAYVSREVSNLLGSASFPLEAPDMTKMLLTKTDAQLDAVERLIQNEGLPHLT